jgi:hypothetical protein
LWQTGGGVNIIDNEIMIDRRDGLDRNLDIDEVVDEWENNERTNNERKGRGYY